MVAWTTAQLANATGLTQRYIRRLVKQGQIKGEKIARDWIVPDEEADRFIKQRQAEQKEQSQEVGC